MIISSAFERHIKNCWGCDTISVVQ